VPKPTRAADEFQARRKRAASRRGTSSAPSIINRKAPREAASRINGQRFQAELEADFCHT
jgi:hypothetical protein